jgi:uncharacterized integral membrane protein (TIGR00697 family)
MQIQEKIYIFLCAAFSTVIITGNLIYQKFVYLPILPFHTFELSVGAILYPLTFLITDLIAEFYGKDKARFCVKLAISMNILTAVIIGGMDQLEAANWSKIDNAMFHKVFGFYSIAFLGSIIANYIAQLVDIKIYLWIRNLTKEKYLWLRNNLSTSISLFIDTTIVISFLTIFGVLPMEQMSSLIINSYIFKLFFTIFSTPLFYLAFYIIKTISKRNSTPFEPK